MNDFCLLEELKERVKKIQLRRKEAGKVDDKPIYMRPIATQLLKDREKLLQRYEETKEMDEVQVLRAKLEEVEGERD